MFLFFGSVHLATNLAGLTDVPGWRWGAFIWPNDVTDWTLVLVHCACTLLAHLATAAGYRDTREGMVAFLQLTEVPWVYVLDVSVLGEPTSVLATIGCAVVFLGALAAALQGSR